jgi:hypothetical protein
MIPLLDVGTKTTHPSPAAPTHHYHVHQPGNFWSRVFVTVEEVRVQEW